MDVKWRRSVSLGFLSLLIIASLIYGFWPQPVRVEVAAIRRAPLEVSIVDEGKTQVSHRFLVSSPVTGMAQRIEFQVGTAVKQGETLLIIEPSRPTILDLRERAQAQARIAAAEAALSAAESRAAALKSESELAARNAARITRLCKGECASRQQQDQAVTQAQIASANQHSAKFAVKVARYDLQEARSVLSLTAGQRGKQPTELVRVNSPIDGRVLKVIHESEGHVAPGTPLLEIGNPHSLEVSTDVLSEDAVRIHIGTPVVYERWGGNKALTGIVTSVEPVAFTKVSSLGVEEQRVQVISNITSDPELWTRLGDHYRVDVRFVLWKGDNILQVPTSALFRAGDRWAVFVVDAGRAQRRFVELGHRNGLSAEIIKGLKAGDRVITHPNDTIEEGTRVRLR